MGIAKFIEKATKILEIEDFEPKESDKKSIKSLLKKLEQRQGKLQKRLKKEITKDERSDCEDELESIVTQIENGEALLKELKNI
ncbi:MAG: hypothetical protein JXQ76_00755 [Campylobacterales bacterium]|nr:hypothetical protein [Campylobacterales bacterium]